MNFQEDTEDEREKDRGRGPGCYDFGATFLTLLPVIRLPLWTPKDPDVHTDLVTRAFLCLL